VNVTSGVPPVTVTSVSPNNGTAFGGTAVTVNGTGFVSGATVTFGGTAATSVVVVGPTQITATTPAHAAGAVNVVVTNVDTSSGTLTNGYTYNTQRFDANGDNTIDPSDIFYLVNYMFLGGPAPAGAAGMLSGDANGDGLVDPSDIFYVVNYLFSGGPRPDVMSPRRVSSDAHRARLMGSVSLGQATQRDGHWVVPVLVRGARGAEMPHALSLNVRFSGPVASARVHRVQGVEPVFETSRDTGGGLAYLVAFSEHSPISPESAVIAEIEIDSPAEALRMEIDPLLTMLVDRSGTLKATVANGGLQIHGTIIGRPNESPRPKTQNQER
jgi:hypothetical protein